MFIPLKSSMYQSFLLMLFPSPPPQPSPRHFPPFSPPISPSHTTDMPPKPPYAPRPSLTTGHSLRPADPHTACIPPFCPLLLRPFSAETPEIHPTCPNPQVHMPRTNTTHKYRTYIPHLIPPLDLFHTWYALPIQPAPDSRPARPLSRPQMNPSISCIHTSHRFLTQMAGIHGRYSRTVSPFTPPFYGR